MGDLDLSLIASDLLCFHLSASGSDVALWFDFISLCCGDI